MTVDYTSMVEGCRRHDRKAQKALYDALAPKALGVCMRYMQDRQEAQDRMQDGFVLVFENIGKLKDPARLEAWTRRVMVNVCLKYFRRKRLVLVEETAESEGAVLPTDPFGAEEVVAALQQLPPQQRVVFNLLAVEGYEYGEVAKELRCSEVNVRALYSRARGRLRELLNVNKDR